MAVVKSGLQEAQWGKLMLPVQIAEAQDGLVCLILTTSIFLKSAAQDQ
jgi:hypothetical protein